MMLRVLLLRSSAARGVFFSLLSIVLRICRLIVWRLRMDPVDDRDQHNTKWPLSNGRYLKVRFIVRPRCSASSMIKHHLIINDTHRLAFSMLITIDEYDWLQIFDSRKSTSYWYDQDKNSMKPFPREYINMLQHFAYITIIIITLPMLFLVTPCELSRLSRKLAAVRIPI